MTQIIDDYIASLATQLNALSAAQKEDALNFYRAFLRNGDCQSKEEILMELGTPAALAKKIKADYKQITQITAPPTDEKKTSDGYFLNFHAKKTPLQKRTMQPGEFSIIRLKARNSKIFIHPGQQFKINVADYSNCAIDIQLKNHVLLIKEKENRPESRRIILNRRFPSCSVEVTVPSPDSLTSISGSNQDGSIILQNLHLQNCSLQKQDGKLFFNNLTIAQELTVSSKDGNTSITQSQITNFVLQTRNGNFDFKRSICSQLELQLKDGNINIKQCHLNLKITAKDGNLRIIQSQLINGNFIQVVDGALRLKQLNHDLNLRITTKKGNITYRGSSIGSRFNSKSKDKDSLRVIAKNGDVIMA